LTILSDVPYTQPLNLTSRGGFYPDVINSGFDRCVILAQQLREQLNRTLIVPATSSRTPQEVLFDVLETANTANEYAQAAKAVLEDVIKRNEEIVEIRDHVDEQAAKVDGSVEAIENARDEALSNVNAEGDKVKGEVGDLIATASAIADRVSADAAAAKGASLSASQSATQAQNYKAQALQSEMIATQAAQDAAMSAQNAGFAFRFSGSVQANGTYLIQSLTPSVNTKVGDHVVSGSGQVFRIVSVTDTSFTLSGALTSFVGPEGPRGPQGESIVGPRGPQGVPGLQGETGSGLEILDSFDSESQLPSTGNSGDAYFIGEDLYVWSPSQGAWVNKGQIGSGGGITGLMSPDPRTYFLYILNGGEPGGDGDPSATAQLNYAKLNAMVLV
jgi:hypothetical protein